MKLIITGGHLTPALALIDHARKLGDEIIFIGRHHQDAGHQVESREKAEIENRQSTFFSLDTVKIERHRPWLALVTFPKLVLSLFKALGIIRSRRPDAVVSFGGYVAVPVALAAWLCRVPVITHEQTRTMGLANRFIARLSRKVAVSWPETAGYLPANKKVLTGNPLRPELFQNNPEPDFISSSQPIIYITGGNQGSRIINRVIFAALPELVKNFYCIHQTGSQSDFDEGNRIKQTLSPKLHQNYTLRTWYSAAQVGWILNHAYLVIGRSGANTVTEIMAKGVPAIFIPLPHAASDEQLKNAQLIIQAKAGLLIPQTQLTPDSLLAAVKRCRTEYRTFKANSQALKTRLLSSPENNLYSLVKTVHEHRHQKAI